MSWIAVSGEGASWVCPDRFGGMAHDRDILMPRGSIVIETRLSSAARPQTLLAYERVHPWKGALSVRAMPGGEIVLELSQGDDVVHSVLQHGHDERTDVLRVTFSWDSEARWGRITAERPDADTMVVEDTPPPPPLLLEDIYSLVRRPQLVEKDKDVVFFAVSDAIEPVGPMATLVGQVPVLTPQGYRPISTLRCGDTVETRSRGIVPVLARVTRRVPALGSFQPVRLRAPYFGLHRDLVVAPYQRLVIGGAEVEYIFGREEVLIPAISLANGFAAVYEHGAQMIRYHQLLLPGHEPMISAEAELESLYVGRMRRRKDLIRHSLLSEVPGNLIPEHARAGLKVLRPFEAITLAEARAA
ncbi:Hint domain-containing protein [Sagittula sp. NFXS13]|uniref:Hint domain-containing protein n=1 Tax=Sagittula sp. NFXS13 TaxID=2819095 RepID=UPI0032E03603